MHLWATVLRCRKQVWKTFLAWVKPCASYTEPGLVAQAMQIKEQLGDENDLEPSTIIAGKLETIKTQLSPPDQVNVNVSYSPC